MPSPAVPDDAPSTKRSYARSSPAAPAIRRETSHDVDDRQVAKPGLSRVPIYAMAIEARGCA